MTILRSRRPNAIRVCAAMILGLLSTAPVRSGAASELVLGVIGNNKDMVQPYSPTSSASSNALYSQLYDGLSARDAKGAVIMQLAQAMTPNAARDVWTVRLRPNVKRHDGKLFTADDVIASIQYMMDKSNNFIASSRIDFVDPKKLKKIDDLTIEFTLNRPFGLFANAFADDRFKMRAIGEDGAVIGTGPFVLDTFTPGQEARLTRFEAYWGDKPGFEKLRLIDFRDQQALTNALRGGQVDVAYSVPYTEVAGLIRDPALKTVVSNTTTYPMLAVRVDMEPFKDKRILDALKLVLDRQQIVDNAYGGYASIANDYLGNNTPCPAPSEPQRVRDLARARQLLAEAGKAALDLELVTDGAYAGMTEMAQLYAQQASQAGISIKVRRLDPASFLNRWRQWPFLVSMTGGPYEIAGRAALSPGQSDNATHFDDTAYNDLSARLETTSDPSEQCKLITGMQTIEFERGGNLVPAYPQNITVYRDTVRGLRPDLYGRTPVAYAGVSVDK